MYTTQKKIIWFITLYLFSIGLFFIISALIHWIVFILK